jgi:hypothetical protein
MSSRYIRLPADGSEVTPADLAEAREALCRALPGPSRLTVVPLPRRVRLRLRVHKVVDDVAYWLICRDHDTAARRLWQLFRMW